ncbi:hypothetical protein [Halobacillus sp. Marseille-Q1614]|uniref:hypothetical protein n=1 Tax=Halobacillus sp. Marseille-Q1614 TaxID=2709134 RepID=UPI00156F9447|nr:hypothetical protein [Halobacillus sp. Marseille-Q1614]
MNTYTLDRYEKDYAILVQQSLAKNEIMVLKERLIAFAQPGDILSIDFDQMGNLRQVEVIVKYEENRMNDLEGV